MRDDLLLYYERELAYIRQMGAQFAEKYPKVASRLVLEADKCEDPHVERLIESFAFLAARVHLKIDDEFPEITESLLGIVYPHLIRPLPSMSVVQFHLDPAKGKVTSGLPVERNSMIYSRPVDGVPCKFRTCYDTTLWPIEVAGAEWTSPDRLGFSLKAENAAWALRLKLRCPADVELSKLDLNSLRFYLSGESSLVHTLYEILCCNVTGVMLQDPTPRSRMAPITLPPSFVTPVGFGADDGMIPYPRRSFIGYRLLQEYFTFPEKFFFIDVGGLNNALGGLKNGLDLIFLFSRFEGDERRQRLETGLTPSTFRLGCVPVVNLFPHTAEPILLDQQKYEYRITPDVRRPNAFEIFSVEQVASLRLQQQETVQFEPFYSFRHTSAEAGQQAFWIANRRASNRANDQGSEIDLSLVDLGMRPVVPNADTVTVRTVCTNRNMPARLPFGNEREGDFDMETGAPIKKIVALSKPTVPIRPALGKAIQWRLISYLSLNYLSLVEGGKEALQEILKIYNFSDSTYATRVIASLSALKSSPHFARVLSDEGITFARGTRVELELDEEQFVGGGVYLFASVLEHFLGLYTSLNSFSQLVATTRQRKELLREWPPRAGRRILM